MEIRTIYPERCNKSVRKVSGALYTSEETAYAMLLMTAALMDLRPEDDRTAEIVLADCGIDSGDAA